VAPTGSSDPFWITIDKHYGSSDHVVFLNNGIPSLMFITWPDMYYHSSADTVDKLDPTMLKRAGVVGTACMSLLASADDEVADRVVAEALGRGAERMGEAQRKGLAYMADVAEKERLTEAYKEARTAVRHQTAIEKAVIHSVAVLFQNPDEARKKLSSFETLVDQRSNALLNEAKAYYELGAQRMKIAPTEPPMTSLEMQASQLIVERVSGQGRGAGGAGGGGNAPAMSPEDPMAYQAVQRKIPQHMTAELNILIARKMTVLEIRDFLSGEFEPLPLSDFMEYAHWREKMGEWRLTSKP